MYLMILFTLTKIINTRIMPVRNNINPEIIPNIIKISLSKAISILKDPFILSIVMVTVKN